MNEATKTTKDITKKVKVESYDISRSDEAFAKGLSLGIFRVLVN